MDRRATEFAVAHTAKGNKHASKPNAVKHSSYQIRVDQCSIKLLVQQRFVQRRTVFHVPVESSVERSTARTWYESRAHAAHMLSPHAPSIRYETESGSGACSSPALEELIRVLVHHVTLLFTNCLQTIQRKSGGWVGGYQTTQSAGRTHGCETQESVNLPTANPPGGETRIGNVWVRATVATLRR